MTSTTETLEDEARRLIEAETRAQRRRGEILARRIEDAMDRLDLPGDSPLTSAQTRQVNGEVRKIAHEHPDHARPVGDFQEPLDWSHRVAVVGDEDGRTVAVTVGSPVDEAVPVDWRIERRLPGLIAEAEGKHDAEHADASHPWCMACEIRFLRSPYRNLDLEHVGQTDDDLRARSEKELLERARATLYRTGGRVPDATPRPRREPLRLLSLDELRDLQAPEPLIEGVLPAQAYALLVGRDATWKSFLALDMALTIAAGLDTWRDQWVGLWGAAPVLYLAGEGAGQFPARVDAWCRSNGIDTDRLDDQLTIAPSVPDFYAGGDAFEQLLEWAAEHRPVLTVVDTLRRASGAADPNSAGDMGRIVDNIGRLRDASGGTVLGIAHSAKSDIDARGSSVIEDDSDAVLRVVRKADPDRQELAVNKMKDGPDDFVSVSWPTPVEDSLVLSTTRPEAVDMTFDSTSPGARVTGALRALRPQGWASPSEIKRVADTDGGPPINSGTVSRELNKMLTREEAERHTSRAAYRLTGDQPDTEGQ
ncbi:AAA family ATPase [Dermacoccus nishinomiyaensis]|uniref:AAA family ATPase n=1 Tax=Dermacoccus nishinomiyaensis TaxID=1274 RepID=UPI00248ED084|nr:AAA family ATPase [Dermacoccus nishinomiyaensis]